jgi:hypothetical protein
VRLEDLAVVNIFSDVTPCCPAAVHRCFGEKHCFHLQGRRVRQEIIKKQAQPPRWLLGLGMLFGNEFGRNTFLRNVGEPLLDYTALHSRRQDS